VRLLRTAWGEDTPIFARDGGSVDRTPGRLSSLGVENLGGDLNEAIAATGADRVVLLRADRTPMNGEWLDLLAGPLLDNKVAAAYGPVDGVMGGFRPDNAAVDARLLGEHPLDELLGAACGPTWEKRVHACGLRIVQARGAGVRSPQSAAGSQAERMLVRLAAFAGGLAGRAVPQVLKLSARGRNVTHPKHLLALNEDHHWYLGHIQDAGRVLDLGCHGGGHTRVVARYANSVIGVDRNRRGLAKASGNRAGACYALADLEMPLPFADAAFNRVLALDIIEHLDDRECFLAEAHRVLAADGLLLLSAPNAETAWKHRLRRAGLRAFADPEHTIEYTEAALQRDVEAAGFEIAGREPVVLDTALAPFIDLAGAVSLGLYESGVAWKRARALADRASSTGFRLMLRKRED